jgi:hypothetical protein
MDQEQAKRIFEKCDKVHMVGSLKMNTTLEYSTRVQSRRETGDVKRVLLTI